MIFIFNNCFETILPPLWKFWWFCNMREMEFEFWFCKKYHFWPIDQWRVPFQTACEALLSPLPQIRSYFEIHCARENREKLSLSCWCSGKRCGRKSLRSFWPVSFRCIDFFFWKLDTADFLYSYWRLRIWYFHISLVLTTGFQNF